MLPEVLRQPLEEHLEGVWQQHEADLKAGLGRAPLPNALIRKYTMIYTHVLNRGGRGVHSPLDRLRKPVSSETRGIKPTGLVGIKPRR